MGRPISLIVIATLAIVQSVAGVLRALHWFDVGSDLMGQGLLMLPIVGMVAIARGALVASIALLYVLFARGIFLNRRWARWLGLLVAVVNLLLVLNVVAQGEAMGQAAIWSVIPAVIICYLFSPAGRRALHS